MHLCLHVHVRVLTVDGEMATPAKLPTGFRLRQDVLKELEPAAKLGLNLSEIVNDALKKSLRPTVQEKLKNLKAALANV